MKRIILATHNDHKLQEVKAIIGNSIEIVSLKELNYFNEIEENGLTLQANALQKANTIHKVFDENCMADDTGLEVDALQGSPGVLSARYAGEHGDSEANIKKLLTNLKDIDNRQAQFRTVISLIYGNKNYFFEGIIRGTIIDQPKGDFGFGYDSIFVPEGYEQTFAELDPDIKNEISHRAIAIKKVKKFLSEQ